MKNLAIIAANNAQAGEYTAALESIKQALNARQSGAQRGLARYMVKLATELTTRQRRLEIEELAAAIEIEAF